MSNDLSSFILSLKLDEVSFDQLQTWRKRHFPPALNHIPAHLTLLHTVSVEQIFRLREHWPRFALLPPPRLTFAAPRFLGRGVAIDVESPDLHSLRTDVIESIAGDLTRQDQQPFRAHVTVQNKADPAEAKSLFQSLRSNFEPWEGRGESVLVWKYLGGPWSLEAEHRFDGSML